MANLRFAPEFRVNINDAPAPAALRASISSVTCQSGLDGADRVELTLANEGLRWLDDPLLALDNKLTLLLGYAPDPLEQIFVGKIVAQEANFPGGGMPTLTVVAQDRRKEMQTGNKVRWFAIPVPTLGNLPIPDLAVASLVTLENSLLPVFDPIGATLSVLLAGVDVFVTLSSRDPDVKQKLIRKQHGESDYDFLSRVAGENGWEMLIDHSGANGGFKLRFLSPEGNLSSDVTLKYGQSLIDFRPRLSNVGQIGGVAVSIWQPDIKTDFTVAASWDWDRQALDISVSPGFGLPGSQASASAAPSGSSTTITLVEEPATLATAARIILSKLIPQLNRRLTGSGSTIGDTRIRAGVVIRLESVGQNLGGLYRVTSATHSLDSSGFRTSFEARKEIWFGSIPLHAQGADLINLHV
jgi:phage protein D